MNDSTDARHEHKRELIIFTVAEQSFCMDIMQVREIRGWTTVTVLPHAPGYVLGVVNLRGAVVPIVDLAARLGLPPLKPEARHVILVTQIADQVVGFFVTAVSDILSVPPSSIQPMPDMSGAETSEYIEGLIVVEDTTISILNAAAAAPAIALSGTA
ncbi:purine-binding chemotaxis protein CheW [Palleronia marisminoris]|uniref:Chemotaxis protein CheW n=1 Tax=Palleronia marisminoris TaxID=315423 RepID=A0A1Y5RF19_9RHOB|nr:chemotaxis protein CheW [Palleronia marisminoris]SFG14384.1 purine-binding chemotaxis protein CheW [Palleronia marisminoris]SLN15071.1 Chemotaxis protein CheW [Palleronia marisminoris]